MERLEDEQVQAERMSSVWKMLTVVKGSDVLELMAENRSPGGLGSGHGERQLFFGERKSLEQMSWGMKWPVSACCDRILSSTMFILGNSTIKLEKKKSHDLCKFVAFCWGSLMPSQVPFRLWVGGCTSLDLRIIAKNGCFES